MKESLRKLGGGVLAAAYLAVLALAVFAARKETPPLRSDVRAKDLRFDGARAMDEVRTFTGMFGPRPAAEPFLHHRTPTEAERVSLGGNRAPANYLADRFHDMGFRDVAVHLESVEGRELFNVVAIMPGDLEARPRKADYALVVAAHHDTVPRSPGAEDNASGVAAVLELARVMQERAAEKGASPLSHTLVFAVFDGEEIGALGSEAFVRRHESVGAQGEDAMERVRAAVTTEMLGWKRGRHVLHAIPRNFAGEAPAFVPFALPSLMIRAARQVGIPLRMGEPWIEIPYQAIVRSCRVPTGSDDIRFLMKGVPALFLASSSFFNFYDHYHLPTDTPEHLSPEALGASGKILEASLLELDRWGELRLYETEYFLWRGFVLTRAWLAALAAAMLLPMAAALMLRLGAWTAASGLILWAATFASAWFFLPAALVALAGGALAWPLFVVLEHRAARVAVFAAGLAPFLATFGVMAMARLSYGAGFQFHIGAGEWAALVAGLAAYAAGWKRTGGGR